MSAQIAGVNYFVYMLLCADGSYYIGITKDVERRFAQHQSGWDPKAYTHERRPVQLVYCTDFQRIEQAIAWEKQIKRWSRTKKAALAGGDWDRVKHFASRPSMW